MLYRELRKYPKNRFHHSPVIIESGQVRDWFSESDVSEEILTFIEKLSYRIGDQLAFSDLPAVLTRIHVDKEERKLLQALTRTRSLIVRLRVGEDTDFESLKEYWTAGYRSRDILPLLESIAYLEGVEYFDLAHLLPPTPRKYLYTFPSRALGIDGLYPDSFWTSLNFFHYLPSGEFADENVALAHIVANFEQVRGDFQFGDLLLFRDSRTGRALHSCTYVADDIVYTKDGRSVLRPFVLAKLGDLNARYGSDRSVGIEVWRRH